MRRPFLLQKLAVQRYPARLLRLLDLVGFVADSPRDEPRGRVAPQLHGLLLHLHGGDDDDDPTPAEPDPIRGLFAGDQRHRLRGRQQPLRPPGVRHDAAGDDGWEPKHRQCDPELGL